MCLCWTQFGGLPIWSVEVLINFFEVLVYVSLLHIGQIAIFIIRKKSEANTLSMEFISGFLY